MWGTLAGKTKLTLGCGVAFKLRICTHQLGFSILKVECEQHYAHHDLLANCRFITNADNDAMKLRSWNKSGSEDLNRGGLGDLL